MATISGPQLLHYWQQIKDKFDVNSIRQGKSYFLFLSCCHNDISMGQSLGGKKYRWNINQTENATAKLMEREKRAYCWRDRHH